MCRRECQAQASLDSPGYVIRRPPCPAQRPLINNRFPHFNVKQTPLSSNTNMSTPQLDTAVARDAVVDETPISPARANPELEKRLAARPDAQDLKNRHILLDTTAAPCVFPNCPPHRA